MPYPILTAALNMLRTRELYNDPKPDYLTRLQSVKSGPPRQQLVSMGFTDSIESTQQTTYPALGGPIDTRRSSARPWQPP